MNHDPILIAGDGRSGTTLLSVMLDCHPLLSIGAELHFRSPENLGSQIIQTLNLKTKLNEIEWNELRYDETHKRNFHFITRVLRWGLNETELLSAVEKLSTVGSVTSFSERAALVYMLSCQRAKKKGSTQWGFKIMKDLPLYDTYLAEWPDARFVFIVRDGRDVFASQTTDHSSWGYTTVETAARGWSKLIDVVYKIQEKMDQQVFILKYEDLVNNSESVLENLCKFLNVEPSTSMLEFYSSKTSKLLKSYGHPSGSQIINRISLSSIGRYKKDLNIRQISTFEKLCASYLHEFGYI